MILDIDVDRAEAQLDVLIERRAHEAAEANRIAEAWAESERRYARRQFEARRQAWCEYHRRQAALFEGLAAEHREELGRLIDLAGGEGGS